MKTLDELILILIEDLNQVDLNPKDTFLNYNMQLGDVSAIIASILDKRLELEKWDSKKNWMDDCLINKFIVEESIFKFWGVMIWGGSNGSEQWTDPFYFEFANDVNGKSSGFFYFQDTESESLIYSEFIRTREVWDEFYYKDRDWNIEERKWRFKNLMIETKKHAVPRSSE